MSVRVFFAASFAKNVSRTNSKKTSRYAPTSLLEVTNHIAFLAVYNSVLNNSYFFALFVQLI